MNIVIALLVLLVTWLLPPLGVAFATLILLERLDRLEERVDRTRSPTSTAD